LLTFSDESLNTVFTLYNKKYRVKDGVRTAKYEKDIERVKCLVDYEDFRHPDETMWLSVPREYSSGINTKSIVVIDGLNGYWSFSGRIHLSPKYIVYNIKQEEEMEVEF